MINQMKEHSQMMMSLQENPNWMKSVHSFDMDSMNKEMNHEMHGQMNCSWCIETKSKETQKNHDFHQPKKIEDMIHHLWINEKMRNQIQLFMFENPAHMEIMAEDMMYSILEYIMSDPNLRQEMIKMMLEHQDFMNSIKHKNQID